MDWCRLWHEMPNDPKWRVIAQKSGQQIGNVIAVYTHMMVCASQAEDRGALDGWEDEDVAAALDMDTDAIQAIREAMQGKTLDGDKLKGWDKRQPKRERDDASTDRVRKHRESKKKQEVMGGVTDGNEPCNAMKHHVTPGNTQIREDKIREDTSSNEEGVPPPDDIWTDGKTLLTNRSGLTVKEAGSRIGLWNKLFGAEATGQALAMAREADAADPAQYVERLLKPDIRIKRIEGRTHIMGEAAVNADTGKLIIDEMREEAEREHFRNLASGRHRLSAKARAAPQAVS